MEQNRISLFLPNLPREEPEELALCIYECMYVS